MPDAKRRALQYSGVVAWYCALKLELYASYVLSYDDVFGVYEWGSGGIVHLHLLGWHEHRPHVRVRDPNSYHRPLGGLLRRMESKLRKPDRRPARRHHGSGVRRSGAGRARGLHV